MDAAMFNVIMNLKKKSKLLGLENNIFKKTMFINAEM
jgi:hypothetical protein